MSRGKDITTQEVAEIKSFLRDGCNYEEIAELMGRTPKAIRNICWRFGLTNGRYKEDVEEPKQETSLFDSVIEKMNKNASFTSDVTTDEPRESATVEDIIEQAKPEPEVVYKEKIVYKEKSLNEFSFREICRNLYDRGYRLTDPNAVYCIVKQPVNIKDIIANG
jgi:IS30 family transposase